VVDSVADLILRKRKDTKGVGNLHPFLDFVVARNGAF